MLAALIAYGVLVRLPKDKLATKPLDVELVEPRLAVQPKNHALNPGALGGARALAGSKQPGLELPTARRRERVARQHVSAAAASTPQAVASKGARATLALLAPSRATASSPSHSERARAKVAAQAPSAKRHRATERRRRSLARARHGRTRLTSRVSVARAPTPQEEDARRRVAERRPSRASGAAREQRARQGQQELLAAMMATRGRAPDPTKLLGAVKQRIARRERSRQRFRAAQKRAAARTAQAYKALVARTRLGALGGRQLGSGGTRGKGRRGGKRVGLRFYLDGRRVLGSRVVTPPEPVVLPRVQCGVVSVGTTPSTVRMLVTLEGTVHVAYIKHSSGSKRFDRCAMKQARGMKFNPGLDASGKALDVWIHLRVTPALSLAGR